MTADALGFIETRGMTALTRVTDAMHKAADVELLDYVKIGSAYVTVLTRGDVGAVETAVEAGLAALGDSAGLIASNVLPSPHVEIANRFTRGVYDGEDTGESALGLIEAKGLAGLITAHDAALKAARVTTIGFFAVGSGLVTIVLQGAVSDVRAAVAAGREAIGGIAKIHAVNIIPAPHERLVSAMIAGASDSSNHGPDGAVGVVETRGYVGAFSAADAGLKSANVDPLCWKKIGAGLVSVSFGGDVAAVLTATDAGAKVARTLTDVTAVLVVPRAHETVYSDMTSP